MICIGIMMLGQGILTCMSMQFVIIHNVVIKNDECSHDDMQDLACGLFSMIL